MTTITASEARARLYNLLDEAAESHRPIQIRGRRNSAVLVSEDDWRSIEETLHLVSIPGMAESIRKAATGTTKVTLAASSPVISPSSRRSAST